jgi:cytochrome oxidase Cu insertion factor (SCO1/SenC/PrrC family)
MNERTLSSFFKVQGVNWRMVFTAGAIALTILIAFFLSRYTAYRKAQDQFYGQVLEPAQDSYDFRLVDQNGKAFQLSQLRGKVVLFSFGYTHCPDVCPTTLTGTIYQRRLPPGFAGDAQKLHTLLRCFVSGIDR